MNTPAKPRSKPRCIRCNRFLGESNLGGYNINKASKRLQTGYCLNCIEIMELAEIERKHGKGAGWKH